MAGKRDAGVCKSLSHPERRVLRLAAQGRTNDEIAQRVFLGNGTVKGHLCSAFAKLASDRGTVR
jgi:ATP/maltotriose-dependent transcriptional regulator MalT